MTYVLGCLGLADVASGVVGAVLGEVARAVLEKLKRGEKLSIEELVVLMLDLDYRQAIESRKEMLELFRQLDQKIEVLRRELLEARGGLDEKIEATRKELLGKIEAVRKGLHSKIENVHRDLNAGIEDVRQELLEKIASLEEKVESSRQETNQRLDAIYQLLLEMAK